jgi:hypothetical protein
MLIEIEQEIQLFNLQKTEQHEYEIIMQIIQMVQQQKVQLFIDDQQIYGELLGLLQN